MYSQGLNASFDLCNESMPQSYSSMAISEPALKENELITLGQINDFLDGNMDYSIKDITPVGNFNGFFSTDNFMFQKFIQVRATLDSSAGFTAVVASPNLRLIIPNADANTLIFGNITIDFLRVDDLFLFRDSSFDALNEGRGVYKIESFALNAPDVEIIFSPYFLHKKSTNYGALDYLSMDEPLNGNSQIIIVTYEGLNGGKMYYYVDNKNDETLADDPFPEVVSEKRLEGVVPTNYLYGSQFPLFANKMSDIPEGYDFYFLDPQEPDPLIVSGNNNVYNFLQTAQEDSDYVYTFNQLKSLINTSPTQTAIINFANSGLKPYIVQYVQTTITMSGVAPTQNCSNFLEVESIELDPGARVTLRRLEDSCVLFIEGYTGNVVSNVSAVRFNLVV